MVSQNLEAVKRTEIGKNESRRLRVKGFIPAVLYSHGTSESISVDEKSFTKIFKGHISESVILKLNIDGKEECEVFVKDYQRNPLNDNVEHLDLFKNYGW
jgi:large subunit ribosomal protein L25